MVISLPLIYSLYPFLWTLSPFSCSFRQIHALEAFDTDPEKVGYYHRGTGCAGGTIRQRVPGAFKRSLPREAIYTVKKGRSQDLFDEAQERGEVAVSLGWVGR